MNWNGWPLVGLAIVSLAAAESLHAAPPEGKGYELVYAEEFDGDQVNEKDWYFRVGARKSGTYINGLNRKENVYVRDGKLHVVARQEMIDGKLENTGGGIISLRDFGYGYYECLSRPFMAGRGVHSSFWQAGSRRPNNHIFEIDSYEVDSKSWMGCNNLYVHLGQKERRLPWVHRAHVPFAMNEQGWFLDAYEYTPEGVVFYDNGVVVARAEWPELTAQQAVWLTALNGCGGVEAEHLPGESVFEYFRFYARDYPGVNLLPNGSFEYNQDKISPRNPVSWEVSGDKSAVQVVRGDAARDDYKLRLGQKDWYSVQVAQPLYHLKNGNYMLTAKVRSSGGQRKAWIAVSGYGKRRLVAHIAPGREWTEVVIPEVEVTNHSVQVEIMVQGDGGEWLEIDDVCFMKPPVEGLSVVKQPFHLFGDAVWELASKEPVRFSGDRKFYFFDRFVGYGDAMTVRFTVEADEVANMTPLARIPKTGNAGWSVQLTSEGGVVFRIGSIENHTDVVAPNAYRAGTPVEITCVFDRGRAAVYADGRLLQSRTGIVQNTRDASAAGRLGTVGEAYEAVSEVIRETGLQQPESAKMKNFRGTLSKVAVYNKALIP